MTDRPTAVPGRPEGTPRLPTWIRSKLPGGPDYSRVRALVDEHRLHTVCQSAACPNMGECWARGTATFMILGNVCTRSCGFCNMATGRPTELDLDEPRRVAEAVRTLGLRHCVITSVNRDELSDSGASVWAATIRAVKAASPKTSLEVLTGDFKGRREHLMTVLDARPDVYNHNLETVERMSRAVRPQASYERSLQVLSWAREEGFTTKSGLMLGIGERPEEVEPTLVRLREAGVCVLTLGQYLQPSPKHLPVDRWVTPEEFARYKAFAQALGFEAVESGPMVRSSYHADEAVRTVPGFETTTLHLVQPA
jgi:lipoic acid synthetase